MLPPRRMLWIGVVAAILAGSIVAKSGQWAGPALHPAPREVTLLYVGADDCPPCRAWQRDAGTAFRSSAEFAHITYQEVKSPKLFDVLKDEYWPDELRAYRDHLDSRAALPLWLVIADDEIVERGFGIAQWQNSVLPKLRSLLRRPLP
jgi:hypothetical protein